MNYDVHKVDIDKADAAMKFMADWVSKPENMAELNKAVAAAKEALYGLILTGMYTGLWPNIPSALSQVRAKILMAFNIGYYYGKELNKQRS